MKINQKNKHAILALVLLALAIVVSAAWRFQKVIAAILDPEHWLKVLNDPVGAGSVMGGMVTGLLTVMAGLITVLIYVKQQRSEHMRHFFQWIEELSKRFHQDSQFSEVRETLARKREWVRRQICQEMLEDGDIQHEHFLECDRHVSHHKSELDWKFLRQLTDYLYFFEQLLAFGEILEEHGTVARAPDLVNHFGWFLRSLCISWSDKTSTTEDKNRGEDLCKRRLKSAAGSCV